MKNPDCDCWELGLCGVCCNEIELQRLEDEEAEEPRSLFATVYGERAENDLQGGYMIGGVEL